MKGRLLPLLTIATLLCSCASPEEKELRSQIDALDFVSYSEPSAGTYDSTRSFKESEPIDIHEFGFEGDFEDQSFASPLPMWERKDGNLNPFKGKKPNQLKDVSGIFPERTGVAETKSLFSEQSYFYLASTTYYADISNPEKGLYPCFYDVMVLPYAKYDSWRGPSVEAIYSHGSWSYVTRFFDTSANERPDLPLALKDFRSLLLLKGLCDSTLKDYPYAVYMDRSCLYFMNKDASFPNDYIDEFNKREDMHLIYA